MRRLLPLLMIAALASCRGEPVPRDYQNAPPAMTHPVDSKNDSPTQHGMPAAAPQPTTGVEGTAGPYKTVTPPMQPTTTTIPDTPPAAQTGT